MGGVTRRPLFRTARRENGSSGTAVEAKKGKEEEAEAEEAEEGLFSAFFMLCITFLWPQPTPPARLTS